MKSILHFVDGKSFSGVSKKTGKVFNPATGEQSAEVKLANTEEEAQINLLTAQRLVLSFKKSC